MNRARASQAHQADVTKVLLIDDDPDVTSLLDYYLAGGKYTTFTANNGLNGIISAQNLHPDLIVLDIDMPDISGVNVCKCLKSSEETASIPILFLSSYRDDDTIVRCLDGGAMDYISKPVKREKFLAHIRLAKRFSKLQNNLDELGHLALEDSLMGIGNRRAMEEHLNRMWSKYARKPFDYCIAMVDLDNFKGYNDAYGHAQGDYLLQELGDLLVRELRTPDISFRYGGEEVLLVLENCDINRAVQITERLRNALAALKIPHSRNEPHKFVTFSAGVASIANSDTHWEDLVKRADNYLYVAKKEGRNRTVRAV